MSWKYFSSFTKQRDWCQMCNQNSQKRFRKYYLKLLLLQHSFSLQLYDVLSSLPLYEKATVVWFLYIFDLNVSQKHMSPKQNHIMMNWWGLLQQRNKSFLLNNYFQFEAFGKRMKIDDVIHPLGGILAESSDFKQSESNFPLPPLPGLTIQSRFWWNNGNEMFVYPGV